MIHPERLVLIGHPVSQSLSPSMHNAALEAKGASLRYEAIDVAPDDLDATLAALSRTKCGGNFTIPHTPGQSGSDQPVGDHVIS